MSGVPAVTTKHAHYLQETRAVEEHGHLLPLFRGWLRLVRPAAFILSHACHGKAGAVHWKNCIRLGLQLPVCSTSIGGPCLQHSPQASCPLQCMVNACHCFPAANNIHRGGLGQVYMAPPPSSSPMLMDSLLVPPCETSAKAPSPPAA